MYNRTADYIKKLKKVIFKIIDFVNDFGLNTYSSVLILYDPKIITNY